MQTGFLLSDRSSNWNSPVLAVWFKIVPGFFSRHLSVRLTGLVAPKNVMSRKNVWMFQSPTRKGTQEPSLLQLVDERGIHLRQMKFLCAFTKACGFSQESLIPGKSPEDSRSCWESVWHMLPSNLSGKKSCAWSYYGVASSNPALRDFLTNSINDFGAHVAEKSAMGHIPAAWQ